MPIIYITQDSCSPILQSLNFVYINVGATGPNGAAIINISLY